MVQLSLTRLWGCREGVALAVLMLLTTAGANAQESATKAASELGSVDFDYAEGSQANVEFDLGPGMANDLFGIGDALVAGVSDALAHAAGSKPGTDGMRFAADQVKGAREIVQTVQQVVHGLRVRAYKAEGDSAGGSDKLIAHYSEKLQAEKWETILKAHERNQMVTVSAIRNDGAIRGIFVAATDGRDSVLVNVICDVSPESAKKLSNAAVTSGLQAGLSQVLEAKLAKVAHQAAPAPQAPKAPAAPEATEAK
jgi:hypothetical protein